MMFWRRLTAKDVRPIKLVRQSEEAECGLACLVMVGRYLGRKLDLFSVRRAAGPIARGISFATLIQIAETFRISARGIRADAAALSQAEMPLILHWDRNHFVVLERVNKGKALLHDPSGYSGWITLSELAVHYSGFALQLEAIGESESHSGTYRTKIRELLANVKGLPSLVLQIVIFSIFLQLVALLVPYYTQLAVDRALPEANQKFLAVLASAFLVLIVLNGFVMLIRAKALIYLGAVFGDSFAASVMHKLFRLPVDWFKKRDTGEILTKFQSIIPIKHVLADDLPGAVIDGMLATSTLLMMLIYSRTLAAISIGALVFYGLVRNALLAPQQYALSEMIRAVGIEQSFLLNCLQSIRSLRMSCGEAIQGRIWRTKFGALMAAEVRYKRLLVNQTVLQTTLISLESIVIIWVAIVFVINERFSIGMVFAFISYKTQFLTAGIAIVDKYANFRELDSHIDRLDDIFKAADDSAFLPQPVPSQALKGKIELRDVAFRYGADDKMVLDRLNLMIEAGESVAITGPSGGGKSTLAQLFLGLFQPTGGAILVDDVELGSYGYRNYYRQVAGVLQDETLCGGTIVENIVFPGPMVDQAWVEECARAAAIHDEIKSWPLGYFTMVGELGSAVSSGQRQRILLARALYGQPRLLVLDEGTANLDKASERRVNDAVRRLDITRIIFAHRRETIESADRVLTLEGGVLRPYDATAGEISDGPRNEQSG